MVATKPSENSLQLYAAFFPPGSWELKDPIELDSDNSKLLMQKYQNLPENQVRLDPCTVIFVPDGALDADPASHRVIVLQAPQGALLKFDQPVDFQSGKIGRLLGGEFAWPDHDPRHAQPARRDDNLQILHQRRAHDDGSDLELRPGAIPLRGAQRQRPRSGHPSSPGGVQQTAKRVQHGRAGVVRIAARRANADGARPRRNHADGSATPWCVQRPAATENGPEHPGVSNLGDPNEASAASAMTSMPRRPPGLPAPIPLVGSDDEMGAAMQRAAAIPPSVPHTPDNGQPGQSSAPSKPQLPDPPVDIRCAGPFRFDMVHNVATFDEQVDVVRVFADGTTDHMNSDWLAIHLAPKQQPSATSGSSDSAKSADKRDPQSSDQQGATNSSNAPSPASSSTQSDGAKQKAPSLQPSRLEAQGKPVIIRRTF